MKKNTIIALISIAACTALGLAVYFLSRKFFAKTEEEVEEEFEVEMVQEPQPEEEVEKEEKPAQKVRRGYIPLKLHDTIA